MTTKKIIIIALIIAAAAAGGFVIYRKSTVESKRKYLQSLDGKTELAPFDAMTDQEIHDCYKFVKGHKSGKYKGPADLPKELADRIDVISAKYNIFT